MGLTLISNKRNIGEGVYLTPLSPTRSDCRHPPKRGEEGRKKYVRETFPFKRILKSSKSQRLWTKEMGKRVRRGILRAIDVPLPSRFRSRENLKHGKRLNSSSGHTGDGGLDE